MVIAWITGNVSSTIRQSIMYMASAKDMWSNLEKRFALTNRSRKYKLCKDLYALKQSTMSVTEYYTSMKTIWEELDAMNILPSVTAPSPDVVKLLVSINVQKEESRLFQFLNGLNEVFDSQRSQLLMITPLPTVETACSALEQEEAQRSILNHASSQDLMAMFSKNQTDKPVVCTVCGKKGHPSDRCWNVIGYPKWHATPNTHPRPNFNSKPRFQSTSNPKWNAHPR